MNLRVEFRYAILVSLLMLLWLSLEYVVGLHDSYIQFHPYVTMIALLIPIICIRLALVEKKDDLNGRITFKKALISGLIITVFAAIFAVPVQYLFHTIYQP